MSDAMNDGLNDAAFSATRIAIDSLALTLHGVSAEIAQAALTGLDVALARRLNVRAFDHTRWREPMSLRLPPIQASHGIDAETLRGLIADGLAQLLQAPPRAAASTTAGAE